MASLITFKKTDASGADVPYIAIIDATKKVITLTPSSSLLFSQAYYLAIAAVKDVGGYTVAGSNINFTTGAASTACDITSFSLPGQLNSSISGTNISVTVLTGTDVSSKIPSATISAYATSNPSFTLAHNFTSDVNYVITAQDGTTIKTYTVHITYKSASENHPTETGPIGYGEGTTGGGTPTVDNTVIVTNASELSSALIGSKSVIIISDTIITSRISAVVKNKTGR